MDDSYKNNGFISYVKKDLKEKITLLLAIIIPILFVISMIFLGIMIREKPVFLFNGNELYVGLTGIIIILVAISIIYLILAYIDYKSKKGEK